MNKRIDKPIKNKLFIKVEDSRYMAKKEIIIEKASRADIGGVLKQEKRWFNN